MDQRRSARGGLVGLVRTRGDRLVELCARLVQTPSENPPGDTRAVATIVAEFLQHVPGAEVQEVASDPTIVNVVGTIRGNGPGRRLVFNGHLDAFPVGEPSAWTVEPSAVGKSRGACTGAAVSDMKAGIACSLLAVELLASCREAWSGEVVVALAGDEETMGAKGTALLLETVPDARGDAMICGDAGSPHVLRFGEKGFVWLDLAATGKPAHGAHVHKGENAIERLVEAMTSPLHVARSPRPRAGRRGESHAGSPPGVGSDLRCWRVRHPGYDHRQLRGHSRWDLPNLFPAKAEARFDIRLPVGVTIPEVEVAIAGKLDKLDGVTCRIARRVEPNWTAPDHEIIRLLQQCGSEVLGSRPVVNMRVGASDSRLYRARGLAAVVCGPTPYNMGGPDEYVTLEDLSAVAYMHTLAAFDFLSATLGEAQP